MRLHAIGGLCNRLRAIFSYLDVYLDLEVLWEEDETVARAHFLDVFEPVPGVRFRYYSGGEQSFSVNPSASPTWWRRYGMLRARRPFAHLHGSYAAVHVRRTDHEWVANEFGGPTTDADFRSFIDSHELPVFLATDNAETRGRYKALYGTRIMTNGRLEGNAVRDKNDRTRFSTLEDAVADMFICSRATLFKGSNASTFSETIEYLRAL